MLIEVHHVNYSPSLPMLTDSEQSLEGEISFSVLAQENFPAYERLNQYQIPGFRRAFLPEAPWMHEEEREVLLLAAQSIASILAE